MSVTLLVTNFPYDRWKMIQMSNSDEENYDPKEPKEILSPLAVDRDQLFESTLEREFFKFMLYMGISQENEG